MSNINWPLEPWRDDPATDAQRDYIRDLGGDPGSVATKGQASDLIEELKGDRSDSQFSNRQIMFLRFCDAVHLIDHGHEYAKKFIDWARSEPEINAAWDLWKIEHNDQGLQDDPRRVEIGIGLKYVQRIRETIVADDTPSQLIEAAPPKPNALVAIILFCIFVGLLIYVVTHYL